MTRIVHICDTVEGYGIYVSLKAYGIAKGIRPFLLCADDYGKQFKVYLNPIDREEALEIMHSINEKLSLCGKYRKLLLAHYIYSEKGWLKRKGN